MQAAERELASLTKAKRGKRLPQSREELQQAVCEVLARHKVSELEVDPLARTALAGAWHVDVWWGEQTPSPFATRRARLAGDCAPLEHRIPVVNSRIIVELKLLHNGPRELEATGDTGGDHPLVADGELVDVHVRVAVAGHHRL